MRDTKNTTLHPSMNIKELNLPICKRYYSKFDSTKKGDIGNERVMVSGMVSGTYHLRVCVWISVKI